MVLITAWFSDTLILEGGFLERFFTGILAAIVISLVSMVLSVRWGRPEGLATQRTCPRGSTRFAWGSRCGPCTIETDHPPWVGTNPREQETVARARGGAMPFDWNEEDPDVVDTSRPNVVFAGGQPRLWRCRLRWSSRRDAGHADSEHRSRRRRRAELEPVSGGAGVPTPPVIR